MTMAEQMDATIHVGVSSSGLGFPSSPPAMAPQGSLLTLVTLSIPQRHEQASKERFLIDL